MITVSLKKTIARMVSIERKDHDGTLYKQKVVLYLQPNGMMIFRRYRGKKRYGVSLRYCFDKAIEIGPMTGLLETRLEGKSHMKRKRA